MIARPLVQSFIVVAGLYFGPGDPAAATVVPQEPQARFQGGDLYLFGNSIPLDRPELPSGPAILRTDPVTGLQTIVREMGPNTQDRRNIVYDHYRDRLIFAGRDLTGRDDLWAMDASGNLSSLGFPDDPLGLTLVATANDGRIYFLRNGLQYLDAGNVLHTVTNLAGTGPTRPGSGSDSNAVNHPDTMCFDPATNALFLLYGWSPDFNYVCGTWSGLQNEAMIRKLSLSADGSRIVANECSTIVVPGGGNGAKGTGLSSGPDGKLMAFLRIGPEGAVPRMFLVDPVTLQSEIYASNGPYFGDFYVGAGCYSSVLDRAVIVDSIGRLANGAHNEHLRTFYRGQTGGNGDILGDRFVNFGGGTITWLCEVDKPRDTDPPIVQILDPAGGTIVGTTRTSLLVRVDDASGTHVTSDPAGLDAALPPDGGTVLGTVPLDAEGDNVIAVVAVDTAGNGAGTSVTVTRDTLAPQVLITVPADGTLFSASPIALQAIVSDATATIVSYAETSRVLPPGGGPASFDAVLSEGLNTLSVIAVDAARNLARGEVTVLLDETAPLVTIERPTSGECFGAGESTVVVEAVIDDFSATTVDSSPPGVSADLPAAGGIAIGAVLLAEGDNALQVSATDATGRTGSAVVSVRLDTTGPLVTIESPLPASTVRGFADFTATAVDPLPGTGLATVDFLVDGSAVDSQTAAPYATLVDSARLSDGIRTFEVVATDGKSNVGRATSSVLVDNTPPIVTIEAPLQGALVRGFVAFEAAVADGGAGLASVAMTVGSIAPTTDGSFEYPTPIASDHRAGAEDTSRWADGPIEFAVVVHDAAGNDARAAAQVIVDNTAPTRMLLSPLDGSVVSGTIDLIGSSDAADTSLLEILIDGVSQGTSPISPLVIPLDTTLRPDGLMTVTLIATDLAGNSSSTSVTVTVDNLTVRITPGTINLKAKVLDKTVAADVRGFGVAGVLPAAPSEYELRVPGGSPVRATSLREFSEGNALKIGFDRTALVGAVRAGIAAGLIQPDGNVTVQLLVSGRVLGSDVMKLVGK
jgi:hypothetical protein